MNYETSSAIQKPYKTPDIVSIKFPSCFTWIHTLFSCWFFNYIVVSFLPNKKKEEWQRGKKDWPKSNWLGGSSAFWATNELEMENIRISPFTLHLERQQRLVRWFFTSYTLHITNITILLAGMLLLTCQLPLGNGQVLYAIWIMLFPEASPFQLYPTIFLSVISTYATNPDLISVSTSNSYNVLKYWY